MIARGRRRGSAVPPGNRHQLAAVGRGGVLDLAARQVDPAAHLTLDAVHRFVRTDQVGQTAPDDGYAKLTLAMRTGRRPPAGCSTRWSLVAGRPWSVMRCTGHSSSRAAMVYQHAAERRDTEVAARLERLAAGSTPNRTGT